MRTLMGTCVFLAGVLLASPPPAASLPGEKPAKNKKGNVAPRLGIKTPGVLIPFENLKAETEIPQPAKPEWLFFSESLYLPGKTAIEKLNAKTNKPSDPIAGVKQACSGMVSAFTSLWVASCDEKSLFRMDPKTGKVTATVASGVDPAPGGIAASADSIWLLTDAKVTLSRIDPEQNAVVGEVRLPLGCRSLIFGETALWIACPEQNQVLRINPVTNQVEKFIDVSASPQALTAGDGSIWVFCRKDGKIERIDPKTNKVVKTIELDVPGADGFLAFGEGSLWVSQVGFPLTRINTTAEKERVVQQFHGEGGGPLLTSTGAIWMVDLSAAKLLRIDPKRVAATLAE